MKILHLEDNAADAALAAAAIGAQWRECEITVVCRRTDFVTELEKGGHDLVLSDYSMPGFSGQEALELTHKTWPEMPFIFFSGTIGEDRAVAALRSGAADYVLKEGMKRLVPAIKSAMALLGERKATRRLEEQLLRSQRSENLGLLAAGIAHDLNNVLTPILMAAPMLRERSKDPADAKLLTLLEKSAERGAGLVRQILAFAHGAGGERRLMPVKPVANEIVSLVAETFPKGIRFTHQVAANTRLIQGNPTQIHQVLLNLCINARDAMNGAGSLELTAANVALDAVEAGAIPASRPGEFVVLEVKDDGPGIPPDLLERIWEPFFTTKAPGSGTGLGLSTVRDIVESHDGFIALSTAPGKGTSFRVFLPVADKAEAAATGAPKAPSARGEGELILVVDDEKELRDLTMAILIRHGYRVISAADGAEGMALFSRRQQHLSLVISDMQMPNFDGATLSRVIRRIHPGIRILAMSGLSPGATPSQQEAPVTFGDAFLRKPFRPEMLLAQVRALLHPGE